MSFVYTIYIARDTYALLESNVVVDTNIKTAKWNIKINGSSLDKEQTSFVVDKIQVLESGYVKDNKLAPGVSGYFDILIDPSETDVSVRYDISFDFSKLPDGIEIETIEETLGSILVKTDVNTYTGVLTVKEIKELKKNNIRVNIKWSNIETSNTADSLLGLVYNNQIKIPVMITVTQYLGEKIEEYK